jgi:flagellar assembly factor FliW
MSVTIESTRFGRIEIQDEAVIEFPNGLIGLSGKRYALVAREENGAFQWLHSLDDPSLAIPVTNPFVFFQSYEVEISSAEADRIGITDPEQADVYVTVRAGEQLEDFRANLRAPILITASRGYQVINEASDAPVRAPLFDQVAMEQVA